MKQKETSSKVSKEVRQKRNQVRDASMRNYEDIVWEDSGYRAIGLKTTAQSKNIQIPGKYGTRKETYYKVSLGLFFYDYSYTFKRMSSKNLEESDTLHVQEEKLRKFHNFLENMPLKEKFHLGGYNFSFTKNLMGKISMNLRYVGNAERDAKYKDFPRSSRKSYQKNEKKRKELENIFFDRNAIDLLRMHLEMAVDAESF